MVRAGETAGNLDEVLLRLAEFQESSAKLKEGVQGAMTYPIIMLVVGSAIMVILLIGVVPRITAIFVKQGMDLPIATRILVFTADGLAGYWWLLLALIVGSVVGFRAWLKTEEGRRAFDSFKLGLPLFGPIIRQVAVARFSRTTGTMLQSGVPMLRTLDVAKEVLGNVILVRAIENARTAVTEGESLANTLRKTGHFPPAVIHMVGVGERSGTLEQMLVRVAEAFDQDVEMKLNRMTSLLGPIMLLFMAGGVGFAVFALLMPILEMTRFGGY
jgi:general secretion pathway protein F